MQLPPNLSVQRTVYIFERGILGWQSIFGDWGQWPNQAVAWIHQHTPHKAQTLTYFTGPILAGATRQWRAKQFAKLIQAYAGWKIVLVCHSEGTATGLRALKMRGCPSVAVVHLICGAADSDFSANGLNRELAVEDSVGKAIVYIAGKDKAMKLEDSCIGSLFFGLQTAGQPLGLNGPTNVSAAAAARVEVIRWPDSGHSACWEPHNFEYTMRQILSNTFS